MEIFLVSFQMHTATFNKSKVNIHLSQWWWITYFMLSYVVMTFYFFGPSVFNNFPPCSIKIMKNHPTQGKKSETVSLACSVVHGAELFWQAPAPGFSFLRSRSLHKPIPAFTWPIIFVKTILTAPVLFVKKSRAGAGNLSLAPAKTAGLQLRNAIFFY